MALINLSETNYQRLLRKASGMQVEPDDLLNDLLDDLLEETENSEPKLGDLLVNGFGLWNGIEESVDTVAYAQQLRQRSWQRASS